MELGTVAEFAGALASVAALIIAWQANSVAKASRDQAQAIAQRQSEEARRQAEELKRLEETRDMREVAGTIFAWWVRKEPSEWGLMVSNEGRTSVVMHDVAIEASGNRASQVAQIKTLPPGQFFLASGLEGWGLPESVKSSDTYTAITASKQHDVSRICFTDQLGYVWEWQRSHGLRLVSSNTISG